MTSCCSLHGTSATRRRWSVPVRSPTTPRIRAPSRGRKEMRGCCGWRCSRPSSSSARSRSARCEPRRPQAEMQSPLMQSRALERGLAIGRWNREQLVNVEAESRRTAMRENFGLSHGVLAISVANLYKPLLWIDDEDHAGAGREVDAYLLFEVSAPVPGR